MQYTSTCEKQPGVHGQPTWTNAYEQIRLAMAVYRPVVI